MTEVTGLISGEYLITDESETRLYRAGLLGHVRDLEAHR
jgi:hypothetical protein